jgi:hypothetical protein
MGRRLMQKSVRTVATNFNARAGQDYFVDTNAAAVTMTLPAAAISGDRIRVYDLRKTFDTNNLIVNRNGHLIQGDADNLTVATESAAFDLVYSGATYGWRIFSV